MSIFTRIQFDDEVLLELHFDQTEIIQKDIRWYMNPHTHLNVFSQEERHSAQIKMLLKPIRLSRGANQTIKLFVPVLYFMLASFTEACCLRGLSC